MNIKPLLWGSLALSTLTLPLCAKVRLADLFKDNMVLQRDTDAPVWGWADPGETVTVSFGDQSVTATTDASGYWKATLHGLKLGPPGKLAVAGPQNRVELNNVAVGEVWVTAGQSNMQYLLIDQDEIALPANADLRYFECPRAMSLQPTQEFPSHTYTWIPAAPNTRAQWSAVAYYFAKNLNKELNVPIGIIDCTWGGTPGEPWTARESYESVPEYGKVLDRELQANQNTDARMAVYAADHAAWEKQNGRADPGNKGFGDGWASPTFDASGWKTIQPAQLPDWRSLGMIDGGAIWLRKTVDFPATAAGHDFPLNLGIIPGEDTVYFNGEEVGHGGWNPPSFNREQRKYAVPGRLVKAGPNLVAVRLFTQKGDHAYLKMQDKLGEPLIDPKTLNGDWLAQVEYKLPPMSADAAAALPPDPHAAPGTSPSVIFNAMVCPLMPFAIKGALWYQGESNATRGWAYRHLLPLLIEGWRAHWNIGEFPFYIVQLPNLGGPQTAPVEDKANWPAMRESQLLTWKKVPHTGMTVNIDIGEAANLHPHNKKDVGLRLSLLALGDAYGRPIEYSGPVYDSMATEGNKIRLKFTHAKGGLVAKGGGPLKHLAIAGSDQKWFDATAEINGETLLVSSPGVSAPVAVRYAWAANPEGSNLTNASGLPASPFRTDDWPILTQDIWWPSTAPLYQPTSDAPLTPLQYPAPLEARAGSSK